MTSNSLIGESLTANHAGSIINNNTPIAHLDHMLNSLHDEQNLGRISNNTNSMDNYDSKSHRMNQRLSSRSNITDGKIVECSSENAIVYRYYTGDPSSIIDEHFDKAFKQPASFNPTRSLHIRGKFSIVSLRLILSCSFFST